MFEATELAKMATLLLQNWRTTLGVVSVALVASSVARRIGAWYRLRHIKGPFWAAFSRWWLVRHVPGGNMHTDLLEVTERYGMSRAAVSPSPTWLII